MNKSSLSEKSPLMPFKAAEREQEEVNGDEKKLTRNRR
jgi:hypothetical protein